jgi:CheY-like chemotaxis protein
MKKILIIEDEPDVAQTIKLYLEEYGYSVEIALDPHKGLKMLKNFDLLILDLIMPKLSGRAVLRSLREEKIRMPVIVLSAVGLPKLIGEELSKQYPGIIFVAKTEMHAKLIPSIKGLVGK